MTIQELTTNLTITTSLVLDNVRRITNRWRAFEHRLFYVGMDVEHIEGGRGYVLNILDTSAWEQFGDPAIAAALKAIHDDGQAAGIMVAWYDENGRETAYGIYAHYVLNEVV